MKNKEAMLLENLEIYMPKTAELIPEGPLAIFHSGPPLSEGPLPSLFYFALSGKDSIELDPYNQPVTFLNASSIRVFSFTIPGHGEGLKNKDALLNWAESFANGENPIAHFIDGVLESIDFLIESHYVDPQKMATAGLSRGAFIAAHLAAREERISHLLGFAPLTRLDLVNEFSSQLSLNVESLNLENLIPKLMHKNVHFYIGNLDARVHTEECFRFIHNLATYAAANRIRNLNFELSIVPSIGHLGHGTSPETFLQGINWLKAKMGIL